MRFDVKVGGKKPPILKMTERRLRHYVTEADIYRGLIGDFIIGAKMPSPIPGRVDPVGSFGIFEFHGSIFWKDFGLDYQEGTDALSLTQELVGTTREDAVQWVWDNIVVGGGTLGYQPQQTTVSNYRSVCKPVTEWKLEYWSQHWIGQSLLSFYNVDSLEELYRGDYLVWETKPGDPVYHYKFCDEGWKAYKPKDANKDKFRSGGLRGVIEGWEQLPQTGDALFIQSSLKDTMVTRVGGYLACNPTSENSYKALLSRATEINARFKRVYIVFDLDRPGIKAATNLANITGWTPLFLPWLRENSPKDPSDAVLRTGNYFTFLDMLPRNLSRYNYADTRTRHSKTDRAEPSKSGTKIRWTTKQTI